MKPQLFYLGLTYDSTPLTVRERVRPTTKQQQAMRIHLSDMAEGLLILTTCERFELYALTGTFKVMEWLDTLADGFHVSSTLLTRHVRTRKDRSAAKHLLRVAAGLESRVIGEPQILGQVRDAYLQAMGMHTLDPVLYALGRAAIHTGKRVRRETPINRTGRSIATLAVERIAQELDPIETQSIIIIGTGRLAHDLARNTTLRKAKRLIVVGRNIQRTRALAEKVQAEAIQLSRLDEVVSQTDVIITCTSSPRYIVDRRTISLYRNRNLFVVDLSVPRNVDPTVKSQPGVKLIYLDDLLAELVPQQYGLVAAENIVSQELDRFEQWRHQRAVAPIVASIMRNVNRRAYADRRVLHQQIMRIKAGAAA